MANASHSPLSSGDLEYNGYPFSEKENRFLLMCFNTRKHIIVNYSSCANLVMYRPYVVWLHVYDGVESKLSGFVVDMGSRGSYVCTLITLIRGIICVVHYYSASYCRTVQW